MPLFTRHPLPLQTAYSELKRRGQEQATVLAGTPGSVGLREVNGRSFYYRQFYDAAGKKRAEYLGPASTDEGRARAEGTRAAIERASSLVREGRLLGQNGYVRVDPRTGAILGAIANRGLFRAGAVLVGSHAYGALLNEMGVRAAMARVPLRVDIVVPAQHETTTAAVRELGAHAQAMPRLKPLLHRPIDAVVMSREAVVPVRVPRAEALAWHKVLLADARAATSDKRGKDRVQAAVLLAVLGEDAPDAVSAGLQELPPGLRGKARRAARPVVVALREAGHERAAEAMEGAVGG